LRLPDSTATAAWPADDAIGRVLVSEKELDRGIRELGAELSRDYEGKNVLLLGILKGAVFFLSDLVRQLEIHAELDFMAVASYGSATKSSGVAPILKDLDRPIQGRDVVIVEDTIDSGLPPATCSAACAGATRARSRSAPYWSSAGRASWTSRSDTSASRSPTSS
jgi:hypoxanthine-guanine phosphoribosyltransferase